MKCYVRDHRWMTDFFIVMLDSIKHQKIHCLNFQKTEWKKMCLRSSSIFFKCFFSLCIWDKYMWIRKDCSDLLYSVQGESPPLYTGLSSLSKISVIKLRICAPLNTNIWFFQVGWVWAIRYRGNQSIKCRPLP